MVRIDKADFGEIVIDGKSFFSDVSITAKGVVEHVPKKHIVSASDIAPLFDGSPECIVIGTGMEGSTEIEPEVEDIIENEGMELFVDKTQKAVQIFNALIADKKKVAGLFHMTA